MLAAVAGARYSTTPVTTRTADSTDRATRSPRGTGYRRGGSTPGARSCTTRNGGISSGRAPKIGPQKQAPPRANDPREGNRPPEGKRGRWVSARVRPGTTEGQTGDTG